MKKLWGQLDWEGVRGACIAYDWCTCANSDEYGRLRDYVKGWREVNLAEGTNAWDLCMGCAMEIERHSETSDSAEDIAHALLSRAYFYFKED